MPTTEELLRKVLDGQADAKADQKRVKEEQREVAKKIAQTAMDLSVFMNTQLQHNQKVVNYLENDTATGQEGLVKQVAELTKKVATFDKKITIFTTGLIIVWGIIKFLIAKLGILKMVM